MNPRVPIRTKRPLEGRPLPDTRLPDLQSQLEGLLDAVWIAEENWRFDDRLDIALKRRQR